MPHVTIDYSATLAGVFDRRTFAEELHPLVVGSVGSAGVCKIFFRPAAETSVGGAGDAAAVAHVGIGLLPGRSDAQKARLSDAVLALLARHLTGPVPAPVLSVEVRDLAPSYRLSTRDLAL